MNDAHLEPGLVVAHAASLATIVAAVSGILPAVATLFAILFYLVQIWESRTVQSWFRGKPALQRLETIQATKTVTDAQTNLAAVVQLHEDENAGPSI